MPTAFQYFLDGYHELIWSSVLRDKSRSPRLQDAHCKLIFRIDTENKNFKPFIEPLYLFQKFETTHARQIEINDCKVKRLFFDQVKSVVATRGFSYLQVWFVVQDIPQTTTNNR